MGHSPILAYFLSGIGQNTFTMDDQLLYSDIKLLTKVFVADTCDITLFDPFKRVVDKKNYGVSRNNELPSVFCNLDELQSDKLFINLSDYEYIFDFSGRLKIEDYSSIILDYIKNPDGSIRWLYNTGKTSEILCFYNASNTRSKLIATSLKKAQQLGLGRWAKSGTIKILYKTPLRMSTVMENNGWNNFSVFTGTAGLNRSVVLALMNNTKVEAFAKLPLNTVSKVHLVQEAESTEKLASYSFKSMDHPEVLGQSENGYFLFSNIRSKKSTRANVFNTPHAQAISEVFYASFTTEYLPKSEFWKNIDFRLQELTLTQARHNTQNIVHLMKLLKQGLKLHEESTCPMSLTHGDFTPWNMYVNEHKLEVYDWEMMKDKAPALYDVFHFHFQKGLLIERKSVNRIFSEITESLQLKDLEAMLKVHNINVEMHLKLYLLDVVTSNLILFRKQKELSVQHKWLLDAWEEALKQLVNVTEVKNQRTKFLRILNQELGSYPHAFLKYNATSLEQLDYSSDLDIAIRNEDTEKLVDFCENHILVDKHKVLKKSFMTVVELFFKDGSFLSIDLINQFKRKNTQMMDIRPLLTSANYNNEGVMVPEVRFDLEYCLLFYTLNNSSIPLKYAAFYDKADFNQKTSTVNYLNNKYGLNYLTFEELFVPQPETKRKVQKAIKTFPSYSFSNRWKNNLNYLLDTLLTLLKAPGFVVTFTGVDGVGKSTVISMVKEQIEQTFRKEVVLKRHRPGILPILSSIKHGKEKAEEIASKTIPRKGKNTSKLSSFVRFCYYYLDYQLGQVYVYFKYTLRGKIVLYDRYYFDFINDSKRSNIDFNKGVVKWLYRFIFKPKLNIFLYADPEEVFRRKQELNPSTIKELTNGYKDLFHEMGQKYKGKYKALENKQLDKTISFILKEFTSVI